MKIRLIAVLLLAGSVIYPAVATAQEKERPRRPARGGAEQVAERSALELLAKKVMDVQGATQADAVQLLKDAIAAGRPYLAYFSIKKFLSNPVNADPSPELLLLAAQNAKLAAEFDTAIERYELYLKKAQPSLESSQAVADLLEISLDFKANPDRAFTFNANYGSKHRQSSSLKKYDVWFINNALQRKNFSAAAERLRVVFSEKLPLPMEQYYFWSELDTLTREIGTIDHDNKTKAAEEAAKLAGLIREDSWRSARLALFAEHSRYYQNGRGTPEAAKAFSPVIAKAKAYVDAHPNANTLGDALMLFFNGARMDEGAWRDQEAQKREFFVYGFNKLSADEKLAFLNWRPAGRNVFGNLCSGEQWGDLTAQNLEIFKKAGALETIPYWPGPNAKQHAAFLAGVPSLHAAIVNAIAAGGDWSVTLNNFMKNDSWHLNLKSTHHAVNMLWSAFSSLNKGVDNNVRDKGIAQFGAEYVAKTPIAVLDPAMVNEYIWAAWRSSNDKKSDFIPHLVGMEWVPHDARIKKETFDRLQGEFRNWVNNVKRHYEEEGKKTKQPKGWMPDDVKTAIDKIDDSFKVIRANRGGDAAKAPNPLCQKLVHLDAAIGEKKVEQFFAVGRDVFNEVKDYRTQKTPFGAGLIDYLMENRSGAFDSFELQALIVADTCSKIEQPWAEGLLVQQINAMMNGRREWRSLWEAPVQEKDKALKLNDLFAKALEVKLAKGEFSGQLFEYFRSTRFGRGWREEERGLALFEKLIADKAFSKSGFRVPGTRSATVSYMQLIRSDFQALAKKYPLDAGFDEMFIEEAKQTGYLDFAYWNHGHDREKKIANFAAQLLTKHTGVPLGYGKDTATYAKVDFANWETRAFGASPENRKALQAHLDAQLGKTRFDEVALGLPYFEGVASSRSRPERKEYFDALKRYVDQAGALPVRIAPPNLAKLDELSKELSAEELNVLLPIFKNTVPDSWNRNRHHHLLIGVIQTALGEQNRTAEQFALIPHFWRIARDCDRNQLPVSLLNTARSLSGTNKELAGAYTVAGLEVMQTGELNADQINALRTLKAQVLVESSGATIPVPPNDPRYPIYIAQANWVSENYQGAYEIIEKQREKLKSMLKELSPEFVVWAIKEFTKVQRYPEAQDLADGMRARVLDDPAAFVNETRADFDLAYANIVFEQGTDYPRAMAFYRQILANEAYRDSRPWMDAHFQVAEVQRKTKQYSEAQEMLEKLARLPNEYMRIHANYYLAKVFFDQEKYGDAEELLKRIFEMDSKHNLSRLLEAEVNIRRKKYMEATLVPIGDAAAQSIIVPGRPLRIQLEDKTLAIVGVASQIDVRVWTSSGDEEFFTLLPFGDSKTKFVGEIKTELNKANPKDNVIQLLGSDTLSYDFTDDFKRKNKINKDQPASLTVASDATLYASSGVILTREELAEMAERQRIEEARGLRSNANKDALTTQLNEQRPTNQVKPGNFINVRVEDLDQSKTDAKDILMVRITADSGDEVSHFPLEETGTHTGVFEGAVPTATAEATAYASDSNETTKPNFVVSAGDYGAWIGRANNVKPKLFSVDLKDNVPMANMKIVAAEAGKGLKAFRIQTSLNASDWQTVGQYPGNFKSWDGGLTVQVVGFPILANRTSLTLGDFKAAINTGYLQHGGKRIEFPASTVGFAWDKNAQDAMTRAGLAGTVIAHLQGGFYVEKRQLVSFKVDNLAAGTVLAVNGEPLMPPRGRTEVPDEPVLKLVLNKGVHRLDLFTLGDAKSLANVQVHADLKNPPNMEPLSPDFFSIQKYPQIKKDLYREPAKIAINDAKTEFDLTFGAETRGRLIRLIVEDFDGDAPALSKIHLTNTEGNKILPTKQDLLTLHTNQTLEIVPGDRITVTYSDPTTISTSSRKVHSASLTATYFNGSISACFVSYGAQTREGERTANYVPIRRYVPGNKIAVIIKDPDADVSKEEDKVQFKARVTDGDWVTFTAIETEPHSGTFIGSVFTVTEDTKRESELKVREGDSIYFTYLDQENTDPGIPWPRESMIEQTFWQDPEVRVYNVSSQELDAPIEGGRAAPARGRSGTPAADQEIIPVTRNLLVKRPEEALATGPGALMLEGPLFVEVLWPTVALSSQSEVTVYLQTSSGRAKMEELKKQIEAAKAGVKAQPKEGAAEGGTQPVAPKAQDAPKTMENDVPMDVKVPGTIRLTTTPSGAGGYTAPPGYGSVVVQADLSATTPLDDGRFTLNVPLILGEVPNKSLVAGSDDLKGKAYGLYVRPDDVIYIGFEYEDQKGQKRWINRTATFQSDYFFDILDRKYENLVTQAYVGETIFFRAIHLSRDVSDARDEIEITLISKDPAQAEPIHKRTIKLLETYEHTGNFKGLIRLAHQKDEQSLTELDTIPVVYGGQVIASYNGGVEGGIEIQRIVTVHKGADGTVLSFTKRFKDHDIAVQTQFMVAEAYFELAKKHRSLNQESLARREIAQGRRLLEEAMRDNPGSKFKAQGDYLLANLSLEFGDLAENEEEKLRNFNEAVTRFSDIITSFPESEYAPKSQYKKALTFEKLGLIDQACEEYVKLSYRYPDNELVAETIARLGQYFMTKGKQIKDSAEGIKDPVDQERILIQSRETYKTAGRVFGRLSVRFPSHSLAGKCSVLSGQCFILAGELLDAIAVFDVVIANPDAGKDEVAEAMYWKGHAYMDIGDPAKNRGARLQGRDPLAEAYRSFKKCTWDYPESKWAKYARGRLTDPLLARVDTE